MEKNYYQCSEPVPLAEGHFRDIAFNGTQFLLLDVVNSEIYKYDCNFSFIETISLKGRYTSICYDGDEQCYWALTNNSAANIFRLDESLNGVGRIQMRNPPQWNTNNICYDWCSKSLWVSFPNRLAFTNRRSREYTFMANDCDGNSIRDVLILPQCRLMAVSTGNQDSICMVRPDCEDRRIMNIPAEYRIEGMCAKNQQESSDCRKHQIYILLTQLCSQKSFVMCCTVNCDNDCGSDCDCSRDCCHDRCHDCCHPDEEKCPCEEELCKVIHSIALAEVGIAHILNAEGEKIQKAVATSRSTKELLEINESVRCTITHITQLENQLTLKLETAMKHANCKKEACKCQKS